MKNWRLMSDEDREALEPGTEGWRYKRGTGLPRGQWIEELRHPEHPRPGVVVTKIKWRSNGVGVPSMVLMGSTRGAEPQDRSDGFYTVPPGAYLPMVPTDGPENAKKERK